MEQRRIIFAERGHGLPLVLIHGFPLDGRMWEPLISELSAVCRVIVPDLPGFGRSTPARPFSIDSIADDLFARLRELDALPCVVAGFSMGGYVALSFAARHSESLRGLVLVDTRAESDTPQARAGREQMIQLARGSGSVAIADQMLPKMLAPGSLVTQPEIVENIRKIMESVSPEAIEHALVAMRDRADRTSDLASIKVPTLVIVGAEDAITPPSIAEGMATRITGSVLRVVPRAGHLSPMEQPAEVTRAIQEWPPVRA